MEAMDSFHRPTGAGEQGGAQKGKGDIENTRETHDTSILVALCSP